MEVHFPGLMVSRRRPSGSRHTSLVGSADDDNDPASYPPGYPDPYPASYPADDGRSDPGTRVYIRGETGRDSWFSGSEPRGGGYQSGPGYRTSGAGYRTSGAGYQASGTGDGYQASGTGDGYQAGGFRADTVVMGDLGLFGGRRAGDWPKVGVNREPPPRPWFQNRSRLAIAAAGLAAVGFGGFVGVPALLNALGVGTGSQGGACPVCQFPIPSSAAVPAGSGAAPATAVPPATSPARARTRAVPASPPPPVAVVPQPSSTPAGQTMSPLSVTYSATPGSGGQFTGQVTVVNRGQAAITNWQMVVALPYDTVSAVQNAEISDQNGILFLSPAPEDLSIPPGGTVVVSIFASGPSATPSECSFNNVACQ